MSRVVYSLSKSSKAETHILDLMRRGKTVRPGELVASTGLSRAMIHRIFQGLERAGLVSRVGKSNRVRYVSSDQTALQKALREELTFQAMLRNQGLHEDVVLRDIRRSTGIFSSLPENIRRILDYTFTEMLNNAIEHSSSSRINVKMRRWPDGISFTVRDWGIGIFENIKRQRALARLEDAILELLKGKQTTMPERHSGEGIFFTSRAADLLEIKGSGHRITFDNRIDDVFVRSGRSVEGTQIDLWLSLASKRDLTALFHSYTDEDLTFHRTDIHIRLHEADAGYVSRSQARRLLIGLERFSVVVLDFDRVEMVGQGFVDEIFRVWAADHPGQTIEVRGASREVAFMIERARPSVGRSS